jgi:hypothetical protein
MASKNGKTTNFTPLQDRRSRIRNTEFSCTLCITVFHARRIFFTYHFIFKCKTLLDCIYECILKMFSATLIILLCSAIG